MNPYSSNELGEDVHEILFAEKSIIRVDFYGPKQKQHTLVAAMVAGLNADFAARQTDRGDGTSRTASHRPVPAAHREVPASGPAPVAHRTEENGIALARAAYLSTGENQ